MAPRYLVVFLDHVYIEAFDPSLSESNSYSSLQDTQHSPRPSNNNYKSAPPSPPSNLAMATYKLQLS